MANPKLLESNLYNKVIKLASGKTNTLSHNPDAVSAVIGSDETAQPDSSPATNTKHTTKLNFFFN